LADDQSEVIAFLSQGESYGAPASPVERIETHISMVFLAGNRAFKLKRAVRFSYLDFSSVALREQFSRREFELNRRTAPDLYLAVHAITRRADGSLRFDGDGPPVDFVLEMQRFPEADVFDRLAAAGRLTSELMRRLTDVIADFHAAAEITPQFGGSTAIENIIVGNTANLLASCPPLQPAQVQDLDVASRSSLERIRGLLDARRRNGKVRRCHGDLHLRNICLFQGRPTLFDGIEFSDAMSCIDVLYDIAFLLMDLANRNLKDLAGVVFNRYLDLTADRDGLPAIPLFMSLRAAVRAHVSVAAARRNSSAPHSDRAQGYLDEAMELLRPRKTRLIAIGGLSGTGKSTMAQTLAPEIAPPPGARIVRTDVLRKRLFGLTPEMKLPPTAYDQATNERVYRAMQDETATALAAGFTVVADAAFLRPDERAHIADVATRAGVPFTGLWLEAPAEVLRQRVTARRGDASDADAEVVEQQLTYEIGAIGWDRVDASRGMPATFAALRSYLGGR
jgi:aminoglycoside phosphotransferase family enzyme/predicted kinase